jgi:putative peptidoglycan lipid II flippase
MAYAVGLLPFVLMRSATVTFLSRGDTVTPIKALFVAVLVNVALKILLMDRLAQVGLALATSAGAWINLLLLIWLATRQKLLTIDQRLKGSAVKLAVAGVVLAFAVVLCEAPLARLFATLPLRDEVTLLSLGTVGLVVYSGAVLALFGRQWFWMFRRMRSTAPPPHEE